jgi:hypothetical protein
VECIPELLLLLLTQDEEDHSSSSSSSALLHPARSSSRLGADNNMTMTAMFDWIVRSNILYDHSSHRSVVATLKKLQG